MNKTYQLMKEYWFWAGNWHKAGCDFIVRDEGGFSCNTTQNGRIVRAALSPQPRTRTKKGTDAKSNQGKKESNA